MWEDPIVKEVRQARLEIEQECGNDFRKIYQRALALQKKVADKRISVSIVKEMEENLPIAV